MVYIDLRVIIWAYSTCRKFLFTFECEESADSCPDCANPELRDATGEEIAELLEHRAEFGDAKSR